MTNFIIQKENSKERIEYNVTDKIAEAIKVILEDNEEVLVSAGKYDLPLTDGEILGGILYDLSQNLEHNKIVDHVIEYILKKNKISDISGYGFKLIMEDGKLYITQQDEEGKYEETT